jgi:hypothetical protein
MSKLAIAVGAIYFETAHIMVVSFSEGNQNT